MLDGLAVAKAREWTGRQAAAALLHLAIDAFVYLAQGNPVLGVSTGEKVAEAPAPYDAPAAKPALATATEDAPDFVRARRNPQVRAIQKGLMDVREGE